MLTIPNLPTQDKYVDALTLGPVPEARMLKYVVANKSVFARIWPQSKSGTIPAQTDELLITPETNIITEAMGIQFRSAVPGVPAQVIAQLLMQGDPMLGSGTPFSSTISSSGGIQPGVSALQFQKNGVLVAAETALDFEDAGANVWAVVDDAANTRVKVTPPRVITGRVNADGTIAGGSGFSVVHAGAGLYDVTFAVAFAVTPTIVGSSIPGPTHPVFTVISALAGSYRAEIIDGASNSAGDNGFTFVAYATT